MGNNICTLKNQNIIHNAIEDFSKETILKIYNEMCRVRAFEETLIKCVHKNGKGILSRVHLSTGQETVGIALAHVFPNENYFIGHRCIEVSMALGVPLEKLRDEILCLDTGCAKGKLSTIFSYINEKIKIYSHTGFIGEQIPIATGFVLGNKQKTICLTGDGGAEEDYALQAYGFAATHNLPIIYVCNDNDFSIESRVESRRTWRLTNLAKAMGLEAIEVTDDPFTLIKIFESLKDKGPAFVNVRVNRKYSHSGIEQIHEQDWDRFSIVKEQIINLGYINEVKQIEENAKNEMKTLWKEYL